MHAFRPNRPLKAALALIVSLLLMPFARPVDANERPVLTLDVRDATDSHPRILLLAGTWPDACVPKFLRASRAGADLSLQLQVPQQRCEAHATPFEVRIEARTAFAGSEAERQIYRARISVSRGDAAPELLGFRLLDMGALPVTPESGFWWSQSSPNDPTTLAGGGIGIEVQGQQLAVSLLAFASDGSPTWYFGSADLDGRTAQVPLIRLLNGGGSDAASGRQAGVEAGPLLALEFAGPSQARAWLVGPVSNEADAPLSLLPLTLRRAIFDGRAIGSSWLGSWVLVIGKDSRRVDLDRLVTEDGESFRLLASPELGAAATTLDCRYRGRGPSAEVDGCSLVEAGRVIASFGHVGIDRLVGTTPSAANAQLIRVLR